MVTDGGRVQEVGIAKAEPALDIRSMIFRKSHWTRRLTVCDTDAPAALHILIDTSARRHRFPRRPTTVIAADRPSYCCGISDGNPSPVWNLSIDLALAQAAAIGEAFRPLVGAEAESEKLFAPCARSRAGCAHRPTWTSLRAMGFLLKRVSPLVDLLSDPTFADPGPHRHTRRACPNCTNGSDRLDSRCQ
ncbi:hypothetical protein ACQPXH_11925 [Nocardia sp. CA-135953]|uniref:hypothetical protein n=1 Tax=Nocardia sp. CA-135953 TaxID=3239978 RepID=UPI003D96E4C8